MRNQSLEFHNVTFVYDTSAAPLLRDLSVSFTSGWCGIIGSNGSGKTTLLRLACRLIEPSNGQIIAPDDAICCPQRTDDPPQRLKHLIESTDAIACELRGRLKIEPNWLDRWSTLSHGERKRAQIGVALWSNPRLLAIDEPTNHIDADARALLSQALRAYDGIGLLVSHDRELLDSLCHSTLFMDSPAPVLRPGGYSKAMQLAEQEQARASSQRELAKRQLAKLQREANNRAREAAMADRKRSKRHLARGDSDGRAKIDLARVSGKDGKAGRLLRQLEGRLRQTQERLDAVQVSKQYRLGLELSGQPSARNLLVSLPAVDLALGDDRVLRTGELSMRPRDRIALVGPNGGGKSTLIRHIVAKLDLPSERVVYLPQEIDHSESKRILVQVRRLGDAQLGQVMSVISCLGSRPQRLLESEDPSPGELRKILLALGLPRVPNLIIMDEPTNHLDLPSIQCMEEALEQVSCGLLLVSHDLRFLERLTRIWWEIRAESQQIMQLRASRPSDSQRVYTLDP